MTALVRLFALVACIVALAGCSQTPSPPSASVAEQAFRQEIAAQSGGRITVASFKKTDGQQFQLNGVPGYQIDYEAVIEFPQNGSWLAGGFGPSALGFGFSTTEAPAGTMASFLNQSIEGGKSVTRGTRVMIAGSMIGAKKESGWKFQLDKSHVTGSMAGSVAPVAPTPVVAAPAAATIAVTSPAASPAPAPPSTSAAAVNDPNALQGCVKNLKQIDAARTEWGLEHKKAPWDKPTISDLLPYMGDHVTAMPSCPAGGTYLINGYGEPVKCSILGHTIDAKIPEAAAPPVDPRTLSLSPVEQQNWCINGLRQIDGAKQEWALEHRMPPTAVPTEADLAPYFARWPGRSMPICPAGGTYSINAIQTAPACSMPEHRIQ